MTAPPAEAPSAVPPTTLSAVSPAIRSAVPSAPPAPPPGAAAPREVQPDPRTATVLSHVCEALAKARELGEHPGYFTPHQFDSEWNVEENRTWLGSELLHQLPPGVVADALVSGVGTGGTLIGVGQALHAVNPGCRLVGVEPSESRTLECGDVGRHLIEGISDGFVPGILARHAREMDELIAVDSAAAVAEMRRLSREHGLFVGPSSGAHLVAARAYRENHPEVEHVVTLLCDEGEKYIGSHFR